MPFSNDKPHAVNDYKTCHLAVPTVIFRDQAVNYFDKCTDAYNNVYGYEPIRRFGTSCYTRAFVRRPNVEDLQPRW
jgi:hypothetical protein